MTQELMHFYAHLTPAAPDGPPGRYLWRHNLLYLREPIQPPATLQAVPPEDCLGVVWLHNPSSTNRPPRIEPDWGRIHIEPTDGDTLWTIHTILETALDNIPPAAIPRSPYVALEELVYLDSIGVDELWRTVVPCDQITRFSILNPTELQRIRLTYPRSKFVWMAWGNKSDNNLPGLGLRIKLDLAARDAATRSGRDLIGVNRQWAPTRRDMHLPHFYSTYRYSAGANIWTRHVEGQQGQADAPEATDAEFPLHPYDLGTMLEKAAEAGGERLHQAQHVCEDLVNAICASITRQPPC